MYFYKCQAINPRDTSRNHTIILNKYFEIVGKMTKSENQNNCV